MKNAFLNSNKKESCTGCKVCKYICPVNAISMKYDDNGFLYPVIDKEKCIKCGKCTKQCTYTNTYNNNTYTKEVYAAKIKDERILEDSSSGGVFTAFANRILDNGGVVCGCTLDNNFEAKHIFIKSKSELQNLRGSKYIQSDVKNTYEIVKKYLENNVEVLYVGTPCQIAGVKNFLNKNYDKLFLIDLICHGVASKYFFDEYLKYLEKKEDAKIIEYKFRDKSKYGWACFGSYTYVKNGKKIKKYTKPEKDVFFNNYHAGNIFRDSCYGCKYASLNREGDITLADFWGIEKYHKEIKHNRGVSSVIINTKRGKKLFNEIENNIEYIPSKIEFIKKENGNLSIPNIKTKERNKIFDDLKIYGFPYISQKYMKKVTFKQRIKNMVPKKIKESIKYKINN